MDKKWRLAPKKWHCPNGSRVVRAVQVAIDCATAQAEKGVFFLEDVQGGLL